MTAQSSLQIAASSQQQLIGMDQISQSMESINQASGHNAAAAREMAEELNRLRAVAERMQTMIGTEAVELPDDEVDLVALAYSGVRTDEQAAAGEETDAADDASDERGASDETVVADGPAIAAADVVPQPAD